MLSPPLEDRIDLLGDEPTRHPEALAALGELADRLEAGTLRIASPAGSGQWRMNLWVKRAMLLLMRLSELAPQPQSPGFSELDLLPWRMDAPAGTRMAAGCFLRRTAHVGTGSIVMPTAVIQAGAFVGEGAMIDSHVTVGSCAQLGRNVRLSVGSVVGGVLYPLEAMPPVLEDDVVLAGGAALYGGVHVGSGSMITAGTVISEFVTLYDAVHQMWIHPDDTGVLRIPPRSLVGMGLPPAQQAGKPILLTPMILETL